MTETRPAARARHLLIVDDDDRIRELLKEYLARAGFRVTAASGGAPARKLMGSFDFDLAVFDVMMPGEDGFSLTQWLREQRGPAGRTPVLMLTARGEPEDRIEGLKLGADDYLAKPLRAGGAGAAHRGDPAPRRRPPGAGAAARCCSAAASSTPTAASSPATTNRCA